MLLAIHSCLGAVTAEYNIKSMGLTFAKLSMEIDPGTQSINVFTHSVKTAGIFPKLNNEYHIKHDPAYHPQTYNRVVRQKNLDLSCNIEYDYNTLSAVMINNRERTSFPITPDTRDVFSFLAYCAAGKARTGKYQIDANGTPWQASITQYGHEEIKTILGKLMARRYTVTFQPLSTQTTPYVDMVTFNLVNKETKLTLWIGANNLAIKAHVKKKSTSMSWELTGIKE